MRILRYQFRTCADPILLMSSAGEPVQRFSTSRYASPTSRWLPARGPPFCATPSRDAWWWKLDRRCSCRFTIYRRSRNPRPSKIAGIAFSIRAIRVADCFAPAK